MTIKAILFDLGGVLVDFTGVEAVRALMRADPGADGAKQRWATSQAISDFEHGRCDADAFAAAFVSEWDLTVSPAAFLDAYRNWVTPPRPGVTDLLSRLRQRHRLGCFSNTSPVHWQEMVVASGLKGYLDHAYASFEIGMMKPRAEAFAHAADDMGVAPAEILFFDDSPANVDGARAAGMEADQATSVADLRRILGARELL